MDILEGLNPAQREAVEAIEGPVLIIAGPGSGKTRVITHRIAYLIKVVGVNPRRIMAVTFTNKAAREMESRLVKMVGGSLQYLTIGTFHAICARILRQDGKSIGVDPRFVIYDDEDQMDIIKRSLQELKLDPKQYPPRNIISAIGAAKSAGLGVKEYIERGRSYFEEIVGRVYERYQQILTQSQALDFDDLLLKTVQLFKSDKDILAKYQERYLHIQVDEFQDTNLVQYALLKLLAAKHRNICVVGDPDQSIYSWRFADIRNILSFEKDYPDAKVVLLEQNYRSTRLILDAASAIISANQQRKEKGLWTTNEPGEQIKVTEAYTEQEEAQFVVGEVERLVSQGKFKPGDFAVMYRTNAQSRALEEAFIRYGVPYKLVAGTRFYERKEVKDVIAYLRLIQNPDDSVSLLRIINVPGRGIGQQTLNQLSSWAKSLGTTEYQALKLLNENKEGVQRPFSARTHKLLTAFIEMMESFSAKSRELKLVELFDHVVEHSGYRDFISNDPEGEERWENVLELRTVAEQYAELKPHEGLAAFLEGVTLVADVDQLEEKSTMVTLITLHQAKGLEFPVVFIVGMEENILPHFKSINDPAQMEEERRLCYVGVTRAQKRVYLVRAFRRSLMGSSTLNKPSRFLLDIPPQLVDGGELWKSDAGQTSAKLYDWERSTPPAPSLPDEEFKAGERVRHAVFGEGTVVSSKPVKDDREVVVAFPAPTGVKKLSLSFARLEKIKAA